MSELTSEEAKHIRILNEYKALVTDPVDVINLCGYQPSLNKVRTAYHNGELSESDLLLVLNELATTLQGEPESFKSAKHAFEWMWRDMFKDMKPAELNPEVLSTLEQAEIIARIMPEKKKASTYAGPRKAKKKKETTINMSVLPAHLQHLAQS